MEITLSRVLKIKKILAGKLVKVQHEIQSGNSVIVGTEQPDVIPLFTQRDKLVELIVALKIAQATANQKIQRKLFELAETKSTLVFVNSIPTLHGRSGQVHYGSSTEIVHNAIIKKTDKDKKVAELESTIEELQESIDQHNFTTKVTVPDELMKAAGLRR